nr:MAG TPA: hypothetical protein [Caudoviricetes sp.]
MGSQRTSRIFLVFSPLMHCLTWDKTLKYQGALKTPWY